MPRIRTLTLPISGMHCASCIGRVEQALGAVEGVGDFEVSLGEQAARVEWPEDDGPGPLIEALDRAGHPVVAESVYFGIRGMHCASCVSRVERALAAVAGVIEARVNLADERARVDTISGWAKPRELAQATKDAGYEAVIETESGSGGSGERRQNETADLNRRFWLALALTLPVFLLEMGPHLVPAVHHWLSNRLDPFALHFWLFVLTSLVLFGPGWMFFSIGLPNLLRGHPDMNSLVAVGTGSAWGYSVVATFSPGVLPEGTANVYYEPAAVIVTLILLGRVLESRAKGRTGRAIERLLGLQARTARVERGEGVEEIKIESVRRDDRVRVRPGDTLPVDGVIVEGDSWVDESMLTGEAEPIRRTSGDKVVGGTINQGGRLVVRATDLGSDAVLARIVRMVQKAQGAKLPVQALVDRVTAWFVPAVMAFALVTALVWLGFGPEPALTFALVNAVSVLIIACPCAMGLATPMSIMVGTGRAADQGILFRGGQALQTLRSIRVVALDKTGTLTEGRPTLTDRVGYADFESGRILALAAAAEEDSEHPIAGAIVQAAEKAGLKVSRAEAFQSHSGRGIEARVEGQRVQIGNADWLASLGVETQPAENDRERLSRLARTPVLVAIDGRLAGLLAVADPLKPAAAAAIESLRVLGLRVAMISGDHRQTAETVADELGIDTVIAEVLPDAKVEALDKLRAEHGQVAFVGDGINDAPALAGADVGIAIGTGTDIAIESADVVLMTGDPGKVPEALALSRATLANIRQNLFWAFAYNTALIPVAAGALYPAFGILLSPMLAAAAMAISSLFVVTNALRLKRVGNQTAA